MKNNFYFVLFTILLPKLFMMKNVIPFIAALVLIACNNTAKDSAAGTTDSSNASASKLDYPYTIEHPDAWQRGDAKNSLACLKALKAYETGNIDECLSYFGDSVLFEFDDFQKKVSKDTLKAMLTKSRGDDKILQVKMDDWESVVSPDKKVEYVSLWYKQIWEDQKGKTDSVYVMDDLRMKDGKIVGLDEKTRRFAVKKM